MNTEKDYFIPTIEDFHVGYEFEFQGIPKGWHKMVLSTENSLKTMQYNIEKLEDAIRVPYLTKGEIEAEGWESLKDKYYLYFRNRRIINMFLDYYTDSKI